MNRAGFVAVTVACLAASGCFGGDESSAEPVATDLVEQTLPMLPPVSTEAPTTIEAATTSATTEPSALTTTEPAPPLVLGAWDWGAPCRVAVEQQITGQGRLVRRSFTVVLDEVADGFVLSYDDVIVEGGDEPAEFAAVLIERGTLLADASLDAQGRFVGFVDAGADIQAFADQSGLVEDVDLFGLPEIIELTTIDAWFGAWIDADGFTAEPVETTETVERIPGLSVPTLVTTEIRALGPSRQVDPFGPDAVLFQLGEVVRIPLGTDTDLPWDRLLAGDVELEADNTFVSVGTVPPEGSVPAVEPLDDVARVSVGVGTGFRAADRRPVRAVSALAVTLRIDRSDTILRNLGVTSSFDWENAEGCE